MSGAYRDVEDLPSDTFHAATQTVLAWRRTALQVALGAVVAARLLSEAFGPSVFVVGLVGVAIAIIVHGSASAAYAHGTKRRGGHVSRRGRSRIGDAYLRLALVAAFALLVACAGLLWILIQL
jgi:uncharacterized membrane protein YidH (DUF202 family)